MIYTSSYNQIPGTSSSSEEQLLPKNILSTWTKPITKKDILTEQKNLFNFESMLAYEAGRGYNPNSFNGGITTGGGGSSGGGGGTIEPDEPNTPGGGDIPNNPNNPNNPKKNKTKSTALLLLLGIILLNS